MCSTRDGRLSRRLAIILGVGVLAGGGCQRAYVERPVALQTEPIIEDDAMRLRQWSQTSATYPNGSTVAGPTGFTWEPRRGQSEYKYYYGDVGVYFANLFAMPYRFFKSPPNTEMSYRGEWIEPTHHAMPALPPAPVEPATPAEMTEPTEIAPPADPPGPPEAPSPADAPPTPATLPGT